MATTSLANRIWAIGRHRARRREMVIIGWDLLHKDKKEFKPKGKGENTGGGRAAVDKSYTMGMLNKYRPTEWCSECTRSPVSPNKACNLRHQQTSTADTRDFHFETPSLVNHSSLPLVLTSRMSLYLCHITHSHTCPFRNACINYWCVCTRPL